jgi:membrane protein YdbS with pleckstrin-like domain
LIDVILAGLVIGAYFLIVQSKLFADNPGWDAIVFLSFFALAGLVKISITCYIVLLWLNEYYEITPEYIYYRKGLIFKKREQYRIDHIRRITVEDSFLGELFNFATITLFDIRFQKYLDMYLIHNARRYAKVLQQLRPEIEIKEDHVWMPFLKREEFNEGEDVIETTKNK